MNFHELLEIKREMKKKDNIILDLLGRLDANQGQQNGQTCQSTSPAPTGSRDGQTYANKAASKPSGGQPAGQQRKQPPRDQGQRRESSNDNNSGNNNNNNDNNNGRNRDRSRSGYMRTRSERGDFNSCGKWSSGVLPIMLWWSLAWFPYFYLDCPWPYCVKGMLLNKYGPKVSDLIH